MEFLKKESVDVGMALIASLVITGALITVISTFAYVSLPLVQLAPGEDVGFFGRLFLQIGVLPGFLKVILIILSVAFVLLSLALIAVLGYQYHSKDKVFEKLAQSSGLEFSGKFKDSPEFALGGSQQAPKIQEESGF